MRKAARRLTLSRETLRRLEARELGRVAGQQIARQDMGIGSFDGCTDTSCTYFVCEPSNPYPCDTTPLMAANKQLG